MIRKIPISPLTVQLIKNELGPDPLIYDRSHYITLTLFNLYRIRSSADKNVPCGTSFIEVEIPGLFLKQKRTYIGVNEIKAFEQIVRAIFEQRIIETIYERKCQPKVKYKEAVLYAHAKFGLTEEILPYQTLWKRVQRFRRSMET